ncbi:restriction endonuclease subunit S [Morganella morganii]|uniref:Restriction endonuclease subunit S n=1 Tax=Morganella morganii TaxID=582 RepID=A0AAI9HRC3_MORMO|nr:restriction endonuclease subunit S [Morganella morganii]
MTDKQTIKFGDICREVKLTTKDPIADGYERYIGLEHLDSDSLKISRWGITAEDNPAFTRVFKKGHVLFGKRRPYLKKAAIAEFDGVCSGDIIVLESKGNVVNKSLLPFIITSESFWDWAIRTSSGSLSPRTKFKALSEFKINELDSATQTLFIKILSLISHITVQRSNVISFLNDFFEILIRNELFELNDSTIFNANSSIVKTGLVDTNLGNVLLDIVDCEHKTAPYSLDETEFLVIRTNNIKNGKIDFDDIKTTDNDSFREWTKRKIPEPGDIIFTREAPAGESCLIPEKLKICLGQRTVLLIPNKEKILPEFLSRYLNTRFCSHYIKKYIVGTTVERINIGDIPRIRLILPDMNRQRKLVDLINRLELVLEVSQSSLKSISNIRQDLIERI